MPIHTYKNLRELAVKSLDDLHGQLTYLERLFLEGKPLGRTALLEWLYTARATALNAKSFLLLTRKEIKAELPKKNS